MNNQISNIVGLVVVGGLMLSIALLFSLITYSRTGTVARPSLLVFTADWCKYCPSDSEIRELQSEFPNVDIKSVNIDHEQDLARQYHVTSTPTFIFCGTEGCQVTHSIREARKWLSNL